MPRLHMQIWQPGTERKTLAHYALVCEENSLLKTASITFEF